VVIYLRQNNPGLLPVVKTRVDTLRQAHIPVEYKRDLLETVGRECGPEALLSVGQGINSVTYDPIWLSALRSENPSILFEKWHRIEVFSHSKNRLAIRRIGISKALFQRHTADFSTPTTPENLLICGITIGLLECIGCRGLWCEMVAKDGGVLRIRDNHRFCLPDNPASLVTGSWTIGWETHSALRGLSATDEELPQVELPPISDASLATLAKTAADLLMRDVSRQWKIGELARALGLSTRSFQRRLSEAGLSFSGLVRLIRIHEACRLLRHDQTSLTVIGFCAGFSDSAHFSRDFRASVGLTPSEFRASL